MWREYFGFAGAAVAVVNGVLAILIALIPVRRSVLKLRLGAIAVGLGIVVLAATLIVHFDAVLRQERQLAERRDTRERLEALVQQGRDLLGQIRDPQKEFPTRAADEWAQRAEIYLREKFDELAVARFRKDAGDMYGDAPVPAPRLAYWRAVRNRLVNLEAIVAELPSPVRSSPVATPRL
jgi:hypothetical protein